MSKWLEFRVEENCEHAQDVYDGCPLCREERQQQQINELVEVLEEVTAIAQSLEFDSCELFSGNEPAIASALTLINKHRKGG